MDPALIALDFAKAGAVVADMIVSYLAAGAPPLDPEAPDDPNVQDCRSTLVEAGVHLHTPIDASPGPFQSGEHGPSVPLGRQGPVSRLEPEPDPGVRPRSWSNWDSRHHPHRLQDPSERCGNGPGRRYLCSGGIAISAIEPGLAPLARIVRDHRHTRHRFGWCVQSWRVQRQPGTWFKGHICSSRVTYYPRAPPWW